MELGKGQPDVFMVDNQGLLVWDPLCCGIQAPPHSLVTKAQSDVVSDIAEASGRARGRCDPALQNCGKRGYGFNYTKPGLPGTKGWHIVLGCISNAGNSRNCLICPIARDPFNLGATLPLGNPNLEADFCP